MKMRSVPSSLLIERVARARTNIAHDRFPCPCYLDSNCTTELFAFSWPIYHRRNSPNVAPPFTTQSEAHRWRSFRALPCQPATPAFVNPMSCTTSAESKHRIPICFLTEPRGEQCCIFRAKMKGGNGQREQCFLRMMKQLAGLALVECMRRDEAGDCSI